MEKSARNKRFAILLAIALILLAGAVWVNVKLNRDDVTDVLGSEPTPTPEADSIGTIASVYGDYFNSFRKERSEVRAQEIEYLRSIINSGNADEDALLDAESRLLELVGRMEKEFTIESQIRGKGFLDAAASYRGGAVTVVIDGESLTDEEVARILDIVMSETGLPASAVKISLGS
ncbi:MAG: SpoIIIAH-like family protein [Clostridia bacterium]|nr:SpoIIIAH-like family protein [Clostridia bacterium]